MSVKITLEGTEGDILSFTSITSLVKAGQIIAFLSSESTFQNRSNSMVSDAAPTEKPLLANQIETPIVVLKKSRASTNPEKITAFGYYLKQSGKENFSVGDIRQLFKMTGVSMPMNFGRDLKAAIRQGYIYGDFNTDSFFLTSVGEEAVGVGFSPENNEKKSRAISGKRGGLRTSVTVRPEVAGLSIDTNMEGYKDLHSLTKSNKVLWILEYARLKGLNELNSKEIESLGSRLRLGIASGNVPGLTGTSFNYGYIGKKSDGTYEILLKGTEFLKDIK